MHLFLAGAILVMTLTNFAHDTLPHVFTTQRIAAQKVDDSHAHYFE